MFQKKTIWLPMWSGITLLIMLLVTSEDWWQCSEGVRTVLSESIAYVYNTDFILLGRPLMELAVIYILSFLLGYLLGAIPFGLLVGKAKGIDVRESGSGNIGATNVFRTVGPGWGASVFTLDFLKGLLAAFVLPILVAALFATDPPYLTGLVGGCAAILGHNYPIYIRFRGGKGVATSAGMLAGIAPVPFLSGVGVWLLVFLLTRYVSVGSIAAAVAVAASSWLYNGSGGYTLPILITIMAAFAIFRHRSNIQRLMQGTESKVSFKRQEGADA